MELSAARIRVCERGGVSEPGVLLWPGFGFARGYFSGVEQLLPGRTVAVDPPGWGGSPVLKHYSYQALVELAAALLQRYRCTAIVGHSLGGSIALGVANNPPPGLHAVVLVDGGYLDDAAQADLGSPRPRSYQQALEWAVEMEPRYPDWDAARTNLAADCGGVWTPSMEAALRDVLAEVDGEIRAIVPAETVARMALAASGLDVAALARGVTVPTLLIACCRPEQHRARKERAWQSFARSSPLISVHVAEDWYHHPFLQAPGASAAVVADWLKALIR